MSEGGRNIRTKDGIFMVQNARRSARSGVSLSSEFTVVANSNSLAYFQEYVLKIGNLTS